MCGLTIVGEAWCWGQGVFGQLGDGLGNVDALVPVQVVGGHTFTPIGGGVYHFCATTSGAGEVYCWGYSDTFGLGNTLLTIQATPVRVPGLSGITEIVAGFGFTCALDALGGAICWGDNAYGQLGDGVSGFALMPVVVP